MSKKTSREIALERRKAMSDSGKKAAAYSSTTKDRVRSSQDIQISGTQSSSNNQNISKPATKHIPKTQVNRKSSPINLSSKELVIERRKAMSTHGKSAINSSDRTRTDVKKESPVNTVKTYQKYKVKKFKIHLIQKLKLQNQTLKEELIRRESLLPTQVEILF